MEKTAALSFVVKPTVPAFEQYAQHDTCPDCLFLGHFLGEDMYYCLNERNLIMACSDRPGDYHCLPISTVCQLVAESVGRETETLAKWEFALTLARGAGLV